MRRYWTGLHIEEAKAMVMFFPSEGSTPCLVHFKKMDFVEAELKSTCVDIDSRGPS